MITNKKIIAACLAFFAFSGVANAGTAEDVTLHVEAQVTNVQIENFIMEFHWLAGPMTVISTGHYQMNLAPHIDAVNNVISFDRVYGYFDMTLNSATAFDVVASVNTTHLSCVASSGDCQPGETLEGDLYGATIPWSTTIPTLASIPKPSSLNVGTDYEAIAVSSQNNLGYAITSTSPLRSISAPTHYYLPGMYGITSASFLTTKSGEYSAKQIVSVTAQVTT